METIVKCTCKDCLNNYKGYCTAQKIQLKRNKCVDRLSAKQAMRKEFTWCKVGNTYNASQ